MERHKRGSARVVPIIVQPCDWRSAPFGTLQALPKNGRPISSYPNEDAAWTEVAQGIRDLVEKYTSRARAALNGSGPRSLSSAEGSIDKATSHYKEAELLLKIRQGLSPEIQKRYDELIAKRRAESLTKDEYDELLRLTEQIENLEALRMEYLAELARLRQISITKLMEDLGIRSPVYD